MCEPCSSTQCSEAAQEEDIDFLSDSEGDKTKARTNTEHKPGSHVEEQALTSQKVELDQAQQDLDIASYISVGEVALGMLDYTGSDFAHLETDTHDSTKWTML